MEHDFLIPEGIPPPKPRQLLDRVRMECLTVEAIVAAEAQFAVDGARALFNGMEQDALARVESILCPPARPAIEDIIAKVGDVLLAGFSIPPQDSMCFRTGYDEGTGRLTFERIPHEAFMDTRAAVRPLSERELIQCAFDAEDKTIPRISKRVIAMTSEHQAIDWSELRAEDRAMQERVSKAMREAIDQHQRQILELLSRGAKPNTATLVINEGRVSVSPDGKELKLTPMASIIKGGMQS